MFYGAEPFLKGDLKFKQVEETSHVQSTTQRKTNVIRITSAYNQLCIDAAVCVSGSIRTTKTKELVDRQVPELSKADLAILTHRKDVTASGDRMLGQQRHPTHCSSVTRCR